LAVTLEHLERTLNEASDACQRLARLDEGQSPRWHFALECVHKALAALGGAGPIRSPSEFGFVLRQRREEAGLTQAEVAGKAGLSEVLIRSIEVGRRRATIKTLKRLAAVRELRLEVEHLIPACSAETGPPRQAMNWFVPPHFDGIAMLEDLKRRLLYGGGIEQTYCYLDHQSAADWCDHANEPRYVATYRAAMPLEEVASKLVELEGNRPLDYIALGPGDGALETRLAQALVDRLQEERRDIRYYLLDISLPLLSKSHRIAKDKLDSVRGVVVMAMQGNFHFLPYFEQIFYSPARRRRFFTMLGFTFGNLDNEEWFLRESLRAATIGDLLLIDFLVGLAPSTDPARIRARDPALNAAPRDTLVRWLSGPFRRYTEYRETEVRWELAGSSAVPGSYQLETVVTLNAGTEKRRYTMWRVRRYDPESLRLFMSNMGWDCLCLSPFGTKDGPTALMLLRKRSEPLM
jgi:transcriptional regulator with XRE-family HTH domain